MLLRMSQWAWSLQKASEIIETTTFKGPREGHIGGIFLLMEAPIKAWWSAPVKALWSSNKTGDVYVGHGHTYLREVTMPRSLTRRIRNVAPCGSAKTGPRGMVNQIVAPNLKRQHGTCVNLLIATLGF